MAAVGLVEYAGPLAPRGVPDIDRSFCEPPGGVGAAQAVGKAARLWIMAGHRFALPARLADQVAAIYSYPDRATLALCGRGGESQTLAALIKLACPAPAWRPG